AFLPNPRRSNFAFEPDRNTPPLASMATNMHWMEHSRGREERSWGPSHEGGSNLSITSGELALSAMYPSPGSPHARPVNRMLSRARTRSPTRPLVLEDVSPRQATLRGNANDRGGTNGDSSSWEERSISWESADACNLILLGFVSSFIAVLVWGWIDAIRKKHYDIAVGLVTVLFVGMVVCAFSYRRRMANITRAERERVEMVEMIQLSSEQATAQDGQHGGKGIPLQLRECYDLFDYAPEGD
ncbi:unnamed protein product, partial [Discosporangium mesarthrocarpum]